NRGKRSSRLVAGALGLVVGLGAARPAAARVNLNVSLTAWAPSFGAVPGTSVYYSGASGCDMYRYSGSYYACDNGAWYSCNQYPGRFRPISVRSVPRAVIQVSFGGGHGGRYGQQYGQYGGQYGGGYSRGDGTCGRGQDREKGAGRA